MKRVKLGIAILLLLVLLSIGTMLTVQHQTKALLEQLDNLESIVDTGDLEAAEAPFTEFTAQWEQTERILNFVVWRDRIVRIRCAVQTVTNSNLNCRKHACGFSDFGKENFRCCAISSKRLFLKN